ncbi:hypothetical protein VSDG_00938 [Cytospora chrysosperma]|uniref:Glucose-methanol-choline oxidoreductase N-terminal domain-containing protein n=1 Tax=Cytospora chrysosperma TaxID=252740 RepID=A0A423WLG4_CYTCH|nr:hypothetical protein VSDG_00938 [Valsa sordida]
MRSAILSSAALAGLARTAAAATVASAYTDPNTGIDFQTYFASDIEYSFGLALPETIETDFIGQMVVPLTDSAGWGGVSLGGAMVNKLLVVAWPGSSSDVMASLRVATSYANPSVYSNSSVNILPIANGTFVNSTHLSYTFLCQGCIVGGTTTFKATDETPVLGYAVSSTDPTDVSDSTTALTYHDAGFGEYGVVAASAQSANFETWASWASATTTTTPGSGSNSTVPGSSNSTVVPTTSNVTYDVIVVGGGPAGIIAAERIAEAGSSVLLIERGPANTVDLGSTQALSWNSSLTPYDVPALGSSLGSVSGVKMCSDTASTAGCLLGGSSSINGENFIHPPEHDFERWPTGWNWADLSDAAARLYERNPGTTQPSADGVYYNDLAFEVVSSYLSAEGWSEVDSIQSPNEKHMAYSRPAWSISNHLRAGPARTYMPYAQQLENFTLKLETKVIQVKRTGSNVTGVLVELEDGSQQIIDLNAGGKVVLAAGALSTPRILWNSGIGKSDALEIVQSGTTGVELPDEADWIDLPVGHNLMDHAQLPLQFSTTTNFSAYDFSDIATDPVSSDVELFNQGSGVLTQAAQRLHMWTSVNGTDGRTRYLQGTISAMNDNTVTAKVFLTHGSTSTGELSITSSGNTVLSTQPWLADAADKAAFSDFIQWWLDITNGTTSVSSNDTMQIATAGATPESLISSSLVSGDHWVGTTRMGTDDGRSNGTSVVDTDTKVYGTDNLFVVDASIHPDLPTGNTQAIIMVVAEHAAQKIANYEVTSSSSSTTSGAAVTTSSSAESDSSTSACKRRKRDARGQVIRPLY